MSKLEEIIKTLREKRFEALRLQDEINMRKSYNDIINFYENSLKFEHATDGMVIIITEDRVIKANAPKGTSHMKAVQEIFDNIDGVKHIDLSKEPGDFGDAIPLEYNSVFIRMASIMNGPTIVYYPHVCNRFQIDQIIKFNNDVKEFNSNVKENLKVMFEYNGKTDDPVRNLDELVERLEFRLERENSVKK